MHNNASFACMTDVNTMPVTCNPQSYYINLLLSLRGTLHCSDVRVAGCVLMCVRCTQLRLTSKRHWRQAYELQ